MALSFPISVFRVAGRSMEPTLHNGDYVLVYKWRKRFGKGDIVALKHPSRRIKLIKRVESADKRLVFVTGDNKDASSDSRQFGPVQAENIIGKVVLKV